LLGIKRSLKIRAQGALAATVLATGCGVLAGCWIWREATLSMTAGRLAHEAARVMSESDTYALEVHRTLDAVNASRYPYCSEEDMELLSHLLDTSRFLKEIGRIHDNKIVCSTMLGREHLSNNELPKPDSIGTDAVKAFRDSPIFRLPNIKGVVALQAGDSYVVLYPYFDSLREPSPIHRKITTVSDDERKHPIALTGVSEQPAWPQLTRNNDFRVGETMFSTRCSLLSINHICTTAYLSVSEALQANHRGLRVFIAFGGLAGAFFGFFCSVIYWRNQSMEQQLRRAIHRDQLSVVYQPIVNVASRRMVGAEALARWTDEEGVAIGPDIFIKIAEERGFVGEITRLVVQRVLCEFGATLRDNPDFHVSINVAAADLEDPGFPSMLEQSLEQASVSTESVAIELTERGTARHNLAAEAIRQLRQRGHSVHIDDFGTGYSSLAYLHDLSVDAIKIDRAFTQAIGTEAVTVAILPQILVMAETLGLDVIMEGIETDLQASYFSDLEQPIFGQGWLFGRPVPADEFHRLLTEDKKAPPVPVTVCEGDKTHRALRLIGHENHL
jgi:sensor c-di-GMP phosphodiesterase-like protein